MAGLVALARAARAGAARVLAGGRVCRGGAAGLLGHRCKTVALCVTRLRTGGGDRVAGPIVQESHFQRRRLHESGFPAHRTAGGAPCRSTPPTPPSSTIRTPPSPRCARSPRCTSTRCSGMPVAVSHAACSEVLRGRDLGRIWADARAGRRVPRVQPAAPQLAARARGRAARPAADAGRRRVQPRAHRAAGARACAPWPTGSSPSSPPRIRRDRLRRPHGRRRARAAGRGDRRAARAARGAVRPSAARLVERDRHDVRARSRRRPARAGRRRRPRSSSTPCASWPPTAARTPATTWSATWWRRTSTPTSWSAPPRCC